MRLSQFCPKNNTGMAFELGPVPTTEVVVCPTFSQFLSTVDFNQSSVKSSFLCQTKQ